MLEGPDGAGKSTLAAELAKTYGLNLVHTGGPLKDRKAFEDREAHLDLLNNLELRIYDRVPYISDLVYAFLECRDPVVTTTDVSRFIEQVRPVIIYCRLTSSAEMLDSISMEKKAHKSPEHMEKVIRSHPALVASYDKVMHDLPLRYRACVLHYNWKKSSLASLKFSLDSLLGFPR